MEEYFCMKIDKKKYFYCEKIDKSNYFASTEYGDWLLFNKKDFKILLENKKLLKWQKQYIAYKKTIFSPPTLHIVVLTNNCNYFCKYCRAIDPHNKNNFLKMNITTITRIIDFIFNIPSNDIVIEFQGGEALINWETLKYGILYAHYLNRKFKKELILSIVSNLSLVDEEKLKFLIDKKVNICTSLDGPKEIHDKQRIYLNGSSYDATMYWLKEAIKMINNSSSKERVDYLPSALMTTTRYSLTKHVEIINEYLKLGLGGIFIRELSPIGYTKYVWNELGYSPKDFLLFYEKSLDYILNLNLKGNLFVERNTAIRLKKLLFKIEPNFLDLRNPCGAGIGQLAYNPNGDIYTCDEGRIISANGDYKFKLGNVYNNTYQEILSHPIVCECILTSYLDNHYQCRACAFKYYCGICPVHNYEKAGSLYGSYLSNDWCEIQKGIFKIILKKMINVKYRKIFIKWFYKQ